MLFNGLALRLLCGLPHRDPHARQEQDFKCIELQAIHGLVNGHSWDVNNQAPYHALVDEMRTARPERAIELERHGDLSGVWDSARVAQVVSNLIGNAVQHGQDPIVVVADGAGDTVVVSVSNAGAPIAEGKRVSLFEPFRKGDASKGIGLGLFIAREIVRSHGGTIEVASTERATTFTTRWPRAAR